VLTGSADQLTFVDLYGSAFDRQPLRVDEKISHFLMGGSDDIPECLAGYFHLPGGFFLIQPLIIGKPDCLELFHGKSYCFYTLHLGSTGLERCGLGVANHSPSLAGPWHNSPIFVAYANNKVYYACRGNHCTTRAVIYFAVQIQRGACKE
jgi:hypothetical protein